MTLEEKIRSLSPELKKETEDFVEFLLKKKKQDFLETDKIKERELGLLRGTVKQISSDFDEPLAEFGEYMSQKSAGRGKK
jgi:hypothetical protein